MMNVTATATDKRRRLRKDLESGKLLRYPGAISPLVAKLIERKGFDGIYISGAVLSADLALPDIGLTTLGEVAARGGDIARATNLPALIDADTGFGEPANVARTINLLEERGLAGCHLEDQRMPKRCGHLDHKELVSTEDMARKIKAAVAGRRDSDFAIFARTDARGTEGLQAAIDRARAYVDAGADAIFPEALQNEAEFEAFRKAVSVPLLANMTEFGKSPLLTIGQLENLGYNMVIYPVTLLRLAMKTIEAGLDILSTDGTQQSLLADMQTRIELYDLLDYHEYGKLDADIANFKLR